MKFDRKLYSCEPTLWVLPLSHSLPIVAVGAVAAAASAGFVSGLAAPAAAAVVFLDV